MLFLSADRSGRDGLALWVSCSIGIALYPMHGRESTILIRHADEAMYEAKRAGRDQVQLYDQSIEHDPG